MDEKEIIVIILSSTVLSGIITGIVSFIINGKNNRLKYITEDRRTWRKEIREIVDEIYIIKYPSQIKSFLAKLKVRINPYGKDKKEDYIHDSHIWKLIEEIEENPNKKFEEDRDKLVFFLSLLLKFDWDRTKKEVMVDGQSVIMFFVIAYGMSFLSYNHFIRCGFAFNQLYVCTFALFLIFPISLAMLTFDGIVNDMKHITSKMLYKCKVILIAICIIITMIATFKSYGITLEYLGSTAAFGDIFSVVVVVTVIVTITRSSLANSSKWKYLDYIHQIINQKEIKE